MPANLPGDVWFGTSGPRDARVMFVAEAWGRDEDAAKQPLVGQSGQEFTRILGEAGIDRNQCFLTNVVPHRPDNNDMWRLFHPAKDKAVPVVRGLSPGELVTQGLSRLYTQIDAVQPKLIVAMGNYALWALTQHTGTVYATDSKGKSTGIKAPNGIMKWRGSQTFGGPAGRRIPVLPLIHPAAVLRQWELRPLVLHDLSARVPLALADNWSEPERTLILPLGPNGFIDVYTFFESLLDRVESPDSPPLDIAVDIETHAGLIVCIGIAVSTQYAISIPLIRVTPQKTFDSFWSNWQEAQLRHLLAKMFRHPRIRVIGQNFLYDMQYLEPELAVNIRLYFDTMLAQHLLFPGTPKGLDYLSSLYCSHHLYWKDDGKDWHINDDLESQLRYNAIDCVRTLEAAHTLDTLIDQMGMRALWPSRLRQNALALKMMNRGILIDKAARAEMSRKLMTQADDIREWLLTACPQSWVKPGGTNWFDSPQQTQEFLYAILGLPKQTARKTGADSSGKEALAELAAKFPSLAQLFSHISARRSLGVFRRNFIDKPLDPDGRMRCSFNVAGTETFRWSSSENAFGRGTNLQNIPSGNED